MFEDWNGDGKIDMEDEYLDYMMYNQAFHGKPSRSEGTGCLVLLIVLNVILGLMDLFIGS